MRWDVQHTGSKIGTGGYIPACTLEGSLNTRILEREKDEEYIDRQTPRVRVKELSLNWFEFDLTTVLKRGAGSSTLSPGEGHEPQPIFH
jgi:hypothetical protein